MLLCRRCTLLTYLITAVGVAHTSGDRYPIVRNGKVGFIDSTGNEVIAPRFFAVADMAHFQDGLAPVAGPEGAGYIDVSGRFVIGPNQDWGQPRPFHQGIAAILIWGKNGALNTPALIDQSGHLIFSGRGADEQAYFSEGLMPVRDQARWGFVDKSFRWVIAPKYDHAGEFSDGLAPIQMAGKWGYIDKTGNEIVSPRYDWAWQFSGGLGRIRIDSLTGGKWMTMEGPRPEYRYQLGFVDTNGTEVIRPQFWSAMDFQQGRAFVIPLESGRWAIINSERNVIHQPDYEQVRGFHEGLAAACVGGKWGYVDLDGLWTISPQFENGDDFWHGLARVVRNDGSGYIDRTGRSI
jgi:hypothetical protein